MERADGWANYALRPAADIRGAKNTVSRSVAQAGELVELGRGHQALPEQGRAELADEQLPLRYAVHRIRATWAEAARVVTSTSPAADRARGSRRPYSGS